MGTKVGKVGRHASVWLQCSFSAAAACGHAASSLRLAVPRASGVLLILAVLQPPLSKQVSDDVARPNLQYGCSVV